MGCCTILVLKDALAVVVVGGLEFSRHNSGACRLVVFLCRSSSQLLSSFNSSPLFVF